MHGNSVRWRLPNTCPFSLYFSKNFCSSGSQFKILMLKKWCGVPLEGFWSFQY
ncbi:unnamed protein product [Prunus brigantina]